MNSDLRMPLKGAAAAAVLCSALALTACGSTQGPATANAQSTAPSVSPSSAPSNTPSGYASPLDQQGLPEQWQGAPGWKLPPGVTGKNVVSIGGLVAYATTGSSMQLEVVDGTGNVVYTSTPPTDFTPTDPHLYRVTRQGKPYLVYVVKGAAKADPTSVVKPGPVTSATVFGEDGKVVSSGVFPGVGDLTEDNGLIVTPDRDTTALGGPGKELDVLTGKIVPIDAPKGFSAIGASDGVNIYVRADASDNTGEVTNGTWSVPADSETQGAFGVGNLETTAKTRILGSYVEVHLRKADSSGPDTCSVLDAATGKKVAMGTLEGQCFDVPVSSPDGNIVYATTEVYATTGGKPIGVFAIADGKSFAITPDVNFRPVTITDKGDVYGASSGAVAYLDLSSGKAPHTLPGVWAAPVLVSDSGIGVFESAVALPKR